MHKHEGTLNLAPFIHIFDFIIEGYLVLGVRALRVVELVVSCIGRVVCHDCLLSSFLTTFLISGATQNTRRKLAGTHIENEERELTLAVDIFGRDLDVINKCL